MNCGDVLLQVVFPGEAILTDIALPVPAFLLLWLSVLAEGDTACCDDGLVGDCVAERDAGVFVLAVQRRRVELVLLFGGSASLVKSGNVILERRDALENLEVKEGKM